MAAPLLALAVLGSACSSGNGSALSDNGSLTTKGSQATPTSKAAGGDFCAVLRDQLAALDSVFPKDFAAPDQLKAYGEFLEQSNARLLAAAPDDIRPAMETQARVGNAQVASYKAGTTPPADVTAQLRTPEFTAASQQLAAYAKDRCGITPDTTPSG
ncbi:MAG: hypothetical protein QOI56_1650 [Actinomycetota bacterium]|jgi:hypothetical protein|nr:hypothetical protein [Actinomycetota bacterium]